MKSPNILSRRYSRILLAATALSAFVGCAVEPREPNVSVNW